MMITGNAKHMVILVALISSAFFIAAGCQGMEDEAESHVSPEVLSLNQADAAEVVLWENVHSVPFEALEELRIEADRLVFALEASAFLGERAVGDILIAEGPGSGENGEGFWRHVEDVIQTSEALIFLTRDARLEEVVKEGAFYFEFPAEDDLSTRTQALETSEESTKTLEINEDLTGSAQLAAQQGSLTMGVSYGRLIFKPAVQMAFVVSNGAVVQESMRVSGNATFDGVWDVEVNGQASLQRAVSVPVATAANTLQFSLVGRGFTVTPRLEALYQVQASGEGKLRVGFYGNGYVSAGFYCTTNGCSPAPPSSSAFPFKAGNEQAVLSGQPQANVRIALEAGLEVREGVSTYASLNPLFLRLDTSTTVTPPYCPFETKLNLRSFSERGSSSYTTTDAQLFSVSGISSDVPECGLGQFNDTQSCTSDNNCSDGRVCDQATNSCELPVDMRVSLIWLQSGVDLDLYVRTPSGEVLSKTNPTASGGAQMTRVSGGGQPCPECGTCEGSMTLNCQTQTPSGGTCPTGCNYDAGPPEKCGGAVLVCGDFNQTNCATVTGCSWNGSAQEIGPYVESAGMPTVQGGDNYRVWVVNNSGSNDAAPYELHFALPDREDFEIRGDVDAGAGSRSVYFDYAVPAN
ncbi:MAG: hypothetical protein ACNA8W_00285 [Bradymonadaceae bacterium]